MTDKLNLKLDTNNLLIAPKHKDILINSANLELKFLDFKTAVKNSFSIIDLLAIISLWTPLFTAEFKNVYIFTAEFIKGFYVLFILIITIFFIFKILKNIILFFFKHISFIRKRYSKFIDKNEINPEEKVRNISESNFNSK